MFSNAESVYINNKEVASIVTADGGVLYQKDSGYDLLLTCDKPVLSLHDNDSCTVTGVLTLNGVPVQDETIDYNILHNDTVLDSGSLTTDNNGEITLDYAAAGVGDVDVVFSLRSLLQKTYVIEDCDFTIIPDTKVSTSSGVKTFLNWENNNDFILTADYYPVDIWEWFMFDQLNADGSRKGILGVFSSSYDKSNNFGITNIGYNGWRDIMIKWEEMRQYYCV